jgi:hypothetical protein
MGGTASFPILRLRRTGALLDLPWERPLAEWPGLDTFIRQYTAGSGPPEPVAPLLRIT